MDGLTTTLLLLAVGRARAILQSGRVRHGRRMKRLYQERLSTPGLLGSPHCAVVLSKAGIEDVKREGRSLVQRMPLSAVKEQKGAGQRLSTISHTG
jgi:hypothetical protein